MKPQIAFYMASFEGGGAERNAIILANYFVRHGLKVQFWVRHAEGSLKSLVDPRISIRVITTRARLRSLGEYVRLIRQEQPEALLITAALLDGFVPILAKQIARTPTRLAIHNNSHWSKALEIYPLLSRNRLLAVWGSRVLYPRADAILAVSQGVAQDVARVLRIPKERIHVVYNPTITPDLYAQSLIPVEHPWFKADQPPVVLAVGRLEFLKGYDILLEAFAKVRSEVEARLVILGKGSLQEVLRAHAARLGISEQVDMPGFDPNPYRYMRQARVFVLSSRYEGLPNVLIQALACGCPVVSTNCPSGPAEILDGGKYGKLVPVGDVEALAEAIVCTLREPRSEISEEWLNQFRVEYVAQRYLEAIWGTSAPSVSPDRIR